MAWDGNPPSKKYTMSLRCPCGKEAEFSAHTWHHVGTQIVSSGWDATPGKHCCPACRTEIERGWLEILS